MGRPPIAVLHQMWSDGTLSRWTRRFRWADRSTHLHMLWWVWVSGWVGVSEWGVGVGMGGSGCVTVWVSG